MNALRKSLKECKAILGEVRFLNSLIRNCKYIFVFGAFAWILGSLIPDTAHFAVTLFSSFGRAAMFVGLIFTLIKGDEDRFISIISAIISAGALIIIIVELSSNFYFASLESYLFLLFFLLLAVNSGKYEKNKRSNRERRNAFSDIFSSPSDDSESLVQVETLPQKASPTPPETPAPPRTSHAQSELPLQKTPPMQPKSPEPPLSAAAQPEVPTTPTQTTNTWQSKIQRVPSIGAAPTLGRAPRVRIKPKE